MQALDKDVEKRPASARDMMHALADPGPEEVTGGIAPAPLTGASALSPSMALAPTAVLTKPPAPAKKKHALLASIAQLPLKARIPAVRSAKAIGPAVITGPTVTPTPAVTPVRVSSTAKTQDLKLRAPAASSTASRAKTPPSLVNVPVAPARPQSPPPRRVIPLPPPQSQNGRSEAAAGSSAHKLPRLVATADTIEFQLSGASVIIGRSKNSADGVNIDLSSLKRGSDRVSRRHAEIVRRGSDYFIRDLGSLNGTYIGGRGRLGRDQLYKLNDRDQVVFGGATFEFRKG
jgi:hypothetical protein